MSSEGGKTKKGLTVFLRTLSVLLILAAILPVLLLTAPRLAGCQLFDVVSGSMEPEIPVGSMVFVQAAQPETLAPGDVIAFQKNGAVITHRVTENDAAAALLHTKGDANAEEDLQTVPYGDVIGIVTGHAPFVGYAGRLITGIYGKMVLVALLGLGVLAGHLAGRIKTAAGRP